MDKIALHDNIYYKTAAITDSFMRIVKSGFLPGLTNESVRVLFELNLDQITHSRKVYTFSQMLADLGGFYEIAWLFGSVVSMVFVKSLGDNKLVSKMYKRNTEEGKAAKAHMKTKFDSKAEAYVEEDLTAMKEIMTGKKKMQPLNSCQNCCFNCRISCQMFVFKCCISNFCCE